MEEIGRSRPHALRQRQQGDQRRQRRQGAGRVPRRHLLDPRRQAEGGRHRSLCRATSPRVAKAYLIGEATEEFAATLEGKVRVRALRHARCAPSPRRPAMRRPAAPATRRAAVARLRLLRPVPQLRGPGRRFPRAGRRAARHRATAPRRRRAPRRWKGSTVSKASVMLAAGGTGGHLFPAFALAQELGRRDIPVDLVTDMRGDRYGTNFPARASIACRRPRWPARRRSRHGAHGGCCCPRHHRVHSTARSVKPRRRVGFGGYPAFPPLVAASLRGIPDRPARAERRARPRQPHAGQARNGHRHLVRRHQVSRGAALVRSPRSPAIRCVTRWSTGPRKAIARRVRSALTRCWCSAAARARATSPTRCRRRWCCCPRRSAPTCSWCSSAAKRTCRASSRPIRPPACARISPLLRQPARGNGEGPSRHRPLRRLHRRRAYGYGPARDAGSAAARPRQRSAAERDPACRNQDGAWCIEQKDLTRGASGQRHRPPAGNRRETLADGGSRSQGLGQPDAVSRLADLVEELIGSEARKVWR